MVFLAFYPTRVSNGCVEYTKNVTAQECSRLTQSTFQAISTRLRLYFPPEKRDESDVSVILIIFFSKKLNYHVSQL